MDNKINYEEWEAVIGLEVHVELSTKTKVFCSCKTDFGAEPNTQICPVCLGMPGTLPVLNRKVVEYAIKAGLVTNCSISEYSKFDRKNYFYPDLPKAYQITQKDIPICQNGYVDIKVDNSIKQIRIAEIHIEEDAGKLMHQINAETWIDYNRSGVPLIEIVTQSDIRTAKEADVFLKKLRALIVYTGISDCKMNEGSFRCDINISARRIGDNELGVRTEIKNLNSFGFITKAIECEFKRQVEILASGNRVVRETRRFDEKRGITVSQRQKEEVADYRFFTEPDLPGIIVTKEMISEIQAEIPLLPDVRKEKYVSDYELSLADSELIVSDIKIADYFEKAASLTDYPKIAANILISEVLKFFDSDCGIFPLKAERLAEISQMSGTKLINSSTAKKLIKQLTLFDFDPEEYVKAHDLEQINDVHLINKIVSEIISDNSEAVSDYLKGKSAALKTIVGKSMAKMQGRANPVILNETAISLLEKHKKTEV